MPECTAARTLGAGESGRGGGGVKQDEEMSGVQDKRRKDDATVKVNAYIKKKKTVDGLQEAGQLKASVVPPMIDSPCRAARRKVTGGERDG